MVTCFGPEQQPARPKFTREAGWALIAGSGDRCQLRCGSRGSSHGTRDVGKGPAFLSPVPGERGFVDRGSPGSSGWLTSLRGIYPDSRLPLLAFTPRLLNSRFQVLTKKCILRPIIACAGDGPGSLASGRAKNSTPGPPERQGPGQLSFLPPSGLQQIFIAANLPADIN
jgi:hypothetical protein